MDSKSARRGLGSIGLGVATAFVAASSVVAAPPSPPPPRPELSGQTRGIDNQVLFSLHADAGMAAYARAVEDGWQRGGTLADTRGLWVSRLPSATLTYPDVSRGQPVASYRFVRACERSAGSPARGCRNLLVATTSGVAGWDALGWLFEVFDPRATADAVLSALPPGTSPAPRALVLPVQQLMRDKVLNELFRSELFDSTQCPALEQDFPTAAIQRFQPVPMDAEEQERLGLQSNPEPPGPVGFRGVSLLVEGFANGTFDLARLEILGALHRTEGPVWEARQLVEQVRSTCQPVASAGRPPPQPAGP